MSISQTSTKSASRQPLIARFGKMLENSDRQAPIDSSFTDTELKHVNIKLQSINATTSKYTTDIAARHHH